jgi:hypothetical protein
MLTPVGHVFCVRFTLQAQHLNALAAEGGGAGDDGRLQAAVDEALAPLRAAVEDADTHGKVSTAACSTCAAAWRMLVLWCCGHRASLSS